MSEGVSAHGGRPGAEAWVKHFHPEVYEQIKPPEKIKQIKGKGNAKPKAEYLPYVQDFVKGGQWSDVGDLANTDLYKVNKDFLGDLSAFKPSTYDMEMLTRQEREEALMKAIESKALPESGYVTRDEWEEAIRSHRKPLTPGPSMDLLNEMGGLPPEGMKRGGRVHISDNPDTMRMELDDKKMAGGGLAKGLKAAVKAAKATNEPAQMAEQGMDQILVKAAERAAAGKKAAELIKSQPQVKASEALGQAMEKGMKRTTTTQADRTRVGGGNIGGASFPAISEADPAYAGKVWGVMDEGTGSRLTNLTTPDTAWTTMLGSATQLKTNPIVFDKLKRGFLEAMKEGKLTPELEAKINHNLALTFGEGAQIRDPSIWKSADTFEKRAALADLMMGQGIPPGKGGVSLGGEKSGKGVIFRPSDILVKETERGLLHPEHGGEAPTFAAGPRLFTMEPKTEYRPDLHPGFPTLIRGKDLGQNMVPTPTEVYLPEWHRKFKASNPDRKGPGYYDLALGVKGEGLPSQDLNDEFIRHLLREGYKAGGAVKKATGGSISADDLILEERKL
jgi:hypothetical protein